MDLATLASPRRETDTEIWLPVVSDVGQVDGDFDTVLRQFVQAGPRRLPDLLAELDITDRTLRANVLADGTVQQERHRLGKAKNVTAIDVYQAHHLAAVDRPLWNVLASIIP